MGQFRETVYYLILEKNLYSAFFHTYLLAICLSGVLVHPKMREPKNSGKFQDEWLLIVFID